MNLTNRRWTKIFMSKGYLAFKCSIYKVKRLIHIGKILKQAKIFLGDPDQSWRIHRIFF